MAFCDLNVQGFLILAVQKTPFYADWYCKLIYRIIFIFYHKHWFPAQFALPFTALCYSSSYLPIAANESEVSHPQKVAYFIISK